MRERVGERGRLRIWFVLRNRNLGAKFRRQATAGPYTLDFFCPQHRDEVGLRSDAERDAALVAVGIRVLRFTNWRRSLPQRPWPSRSWTGSSV